MYILIIILLIILLISLLYYNIVKILCNISIK